MQGGNRYQARPTWTGQAAKSGQHDSCKAPGSRCGRRAWLQARRSPRNDVYAEPLATMINPEDPESTDTSNENKEDVVDADFEEVKDNEEKKDAS